MTSIRRQLLLGTATATVAGFLVAAVLIYFLTRQFLIDRFDAHLIAKAHAIASMTDLHDRSTKLDVEDAQRLPEFQASDDPEYFEIVADDGQRESSPTLGEQRLRATSGTIQLLDGRPGRAQTVRARLPLESDHSALPAGAPTQLSITVARATTDMDRLLSRLAMLLVVVCGIATAVLLGFTAWMVHKATEPIENVAQQISQIGAKDLSARIDRGHVPRELAPIVSRLNELLIRLDGAFQRERCFTSDAAHELRTPLAGLQTALEVCASQKRDIAGYERVVGDCVRVVRQMHGMIDNLLLLARGDVDQIALTSTSFDINQLLRESWAIQVDAARQRRLHVAMSLPDEEIVYTDREKLRIIVNNVLANAVQHCDEAGSVNIRAERSNGSLMFEVTNTGSRVRAEDLEKVFDRFWRADTSRSGNGQHCGLGLAVCRKLATVVGANICVACNSPGTFTVRLRLPSTVTVSNPHDATPRCGP